MSSWSSRFPAYQVDFQAAASGKRVASTKRRVRWRFGYPNAQALEAGRTGIDCRGEEHDIVIIWSITSGKRQVTMDGQEIHFSISRSGILEHSWASKGNHMMKIIAHAAPPLSATPGFRQYDFIIDGQSFFNMPKVYELGLRRPGAAYERNPGAPPPSYGGGYENHGGGGTSGNRRSIANVPRTREEEEEELKRAINASLEESRKFLETKQPIDDRSTASAPQPTERNEDLLGFDGDDDFVSTPRAADTHSVMSFTSMPPPQQPYAPPGGAPSYPAQAPSTYPVGGGSTYGAPPPAAYPGDLAASYPPPHNPSYPPPGTAAYPAAQNGPVLQLTNGPVPAPAPYGAPPPPGAMPAYQAAPGQMPPGQPVDAFAAPAPSTDPFGLHQPAPVDDPFAPKPPPPPTHNDIHSAILGAYGSQPPPPQPGAPPPGAPPPGAPPVAPPDAQPGQGGQPGQQAALENGGNAQANGTGNNVKLTISGGLALNGYAEPEQEAPKSEYDAALMNLVNIDSINEPVTKVLTLDQKKKLEEEERMRNKGKSKPLPPAAQGMVGSQVSLQQISAVKPEKKVQHSDVMKAPPQLFHPNAAQAGALVVHGQGPPPLGPPQIGQVGQGFGVGYMMQQQQQMQQQYQQQQQQYQQPQYPPQYQPQYR